MTEYVVETIQSYNEYIEKVEKGSLTIAEMLREDRVTEALLTIADFSDGMTWLTQASDLLQQNNVKVDLEMLKITEFLGEINGGLEIQDYLLVADIFEYEISQFFSKVQLIELPIN